MIIGSHVSMSAPDYVLGSVEEALSYDANALMLYTGAPQNTKRKPVADLKVKEAQTLMKQHDLPMENMIIHAPYIINLANSVNPDTYQLAKDFLTQEIKRVEEIGATYLVLHPGSYTTADLETGLKYIINGLNEVLTPKQKVIVCLETMAGKGSEVGTNFEQLKTIIDGVKCSDKLAVCLDTCHINDAGYDLNDFDNILDEFDKVIGLDLLKVVHINDSKNVMGAHKDRHANLGEGEIGFEILCGVANNPRLEKVVKILETPWVDDNAPYKEEIKMLRAKKYDAHALDKYRKQTPAD